jgi:hypothetical protein
MLLKLLENSQNVLEFYEREKKLFQFLATSLTNPFKFLLNLK